MCAHVCVYRNTHTDTGAVHLLLLPGLDPQEEVKAKEEEAAAAEEWTYVYPKVFGC